MVKLYGFGASWTPVTSVLRAIVSARDITYSKVNKVIKHITAAKKIINIQISLLKALIRTLEQVESSFRKHNIASSGICDVNPIPHGSKN